MRAGRLALAEGLAATALEHWYFVGPFADPHFTARERTVGPEAGQLVHLNASYADGFGGEVQWRSLPPVVHSSSLPAPIRMPGDVATRSVNKTVAVFLCARVFVPTVAANEDEPAGHRPSSTLEAQLVGSTSSLASLRVNDVWLPPDRLVTGRRLRESSGRLVG